MDDEQARALAREIWQSINLPNLVENILPTRVRASLVLKRAHTTSSNRYGCGKFSRYLPKRRERWE